MAQASSKRPTIKAAGGIPELRLNMPLDAKKVAEIKKCLDRGTLEITLSHVDLASGRLGESWLYD
jgi:hypothetical protein